MGIAEHRVNRRDALIGSGIVGAGALVALMAGCGAGSAQEAASVTDCAGRLP
jgi:hypothetical protein